MGKYSDEDMAAHKTVAVIVLNSDGTFLVMDHKKHNMIAPVVEKCHEGESAELACVRAVREECGMIASKTDFEYIGHYEKVYTFDGNQVPIGTDVYIFRNWKMYPKNVEPEKHANFRFMGLGDIMVEHQKGVKVSDTLLFLYNACADNLKIDQTAFWKQKLSSRLKCYLKKYRDNVSGTLRFNLAVEFWITHYGVDAMYTFECGFRYRDEPIITVKQLWNRTEVTYGPRASLENVQQAVNYCNVVDSWLAVEDMSSYSPACDDDEDDD